MKPLTVLVVDDDPTIRDGLTAILEAQPDLLPVGEAADGVEAVRMARQLHPDVILMDVTMPRMDGLEATRLIRQEASETRIFVLTVYPIHLADALAAGASGFFLKESAPRDLIRAIRGQRVAP